MTNKWPLYVTKLYHYFLISFYFWLGLVKGLIVYASVPAVLALLTTLEFVNGHEDVEEKLIKASFNNYYSKYQHYRFTSFVFSFLLIINSSLLFWCLINEYSWFWLGLLGYCLVLVMVSFSYFIYYLSQRAMLLKEAFAYGFVKMIKRIEITLAMIVLCLVLLGLAYFNFVLFIVLAPVVYGLSLNHLGKRLLI